VVGVHGCLPFVVRLLVLHRLPGAGYTISTRRSVDGQAFVNEPLLAVGDVRLDAGLPEVLLRDPGADRVGAVLV
jgi:hypothetical protein